MKVSSTEVPPRQVALDIEVEQERVDRAMDQAYRRIAGRVAVPGFRPGKAPRTMVERMVGRERIVEDAIDHLLPDVVSEAIQQEGVKPYAQPRVENVEFDPLRVKAIVPIEPSVQLGDLSGLSVEKPDATVDPARIEEVIDRLRESHAQWVPVERAVQVGDRVAIDLHGEVAEDHQVVQDTKDAEYVVDPEGPQPAPGFAEQLVGMSAGGEKTFTLPMPEDYRDSSVAGKPVVFSVKMHWVKEKQLPEVDDAFAEQVGPYEDAAGLRSAVESQLRERVEQDAREQVQDASLDKLVELSTIEVAPQVIDHQTEHTLEQFASTVERQGLQLEQYLRFLGKSEAEFREETRAESEKRVKRSLALEAFADAQQISVSPSEIEAEIRTASASSENPEATLRRALDDADTRARVESVLREQKALRRLISLATGEPEPAESIDPGAADEKIAAPEGTESDTATASEAATVGSVTGAASKE